VQAFTLEIKVIQGCGCVFPGVEEILKLLWVKLRGECSLPHHPDKLKNSMNLRNDGGQDSYLQVACFIPSYSQSCSDQNLTQERMEDCKEEEDCEGAEDCCHGTAFFGFSLSIIFLLSILL